MPRGAGWLSLTLWNESALVLLALLGLVYWWLTGPFRSFCEEPPDSMGTRTKFLLGLLVAAVAWTSPLYALGHVSLCAHMIQMSLMYFIVPPLLISGCPAWLAREFRRWKDACGANRLSLPPVASLLLFNGLMIICHVPAVFDALMTRPAAHHLFFTVLLAASLLMWRPLVDPLAERRLHGKRKTRYIAANGWILMPACLLLFVSDSALFRTYTDPAIRLEVAGALAGFSISDTVPSGLASLSALADQRWGSLCMIGLHYLSFVPSKLNRRNLFGNSS